MRQGGSGTCLPAVVVASGSSVSPVGTARLSWIGTTGCSPLSTRSRAFRSPPPARGPERKRNAQVVERVAWLTGLAVLIEVQTVVFAESAERNRPTTSGSCIALATGSGRAHQRGIQLHRVRRCDEGARRRRAPRCGAHRLTRPMSSSCSPPLAYSTRAPAWWWSRAGPSRRAHHDRGL